MDGYSRLIACLKVLLPLMALGILSTLFLLSRDRTPVAEVPFAQAEIEERLRDQQITGSLFSGATQGGDLINVTATKVLTSNGTIGENTAESLSAQIDTTGGTRINLLADTGRFSLADGNTTLEGNVVITTSTGFEVTTDFLEAGLSQLDIRSPGPVNAIGPFGTLTAGAMQLNEPEGTQSPHLLFTNGVELIYRPEEG